MGKQLFRTCSVLYPVACNEEAYFLVQLERQDLPAADDAGSRNTLAHHQVDHLVVDPRAELEPFRHGEGPALLWGREVLVDLEAAFPSNGCNE